MPESQKLPKYSDLAERIADRMADALAFDGVVKLTLPEAEMIRAALDEADTALRADEAASQAIQDQITIWDEATIADAQYHDAKENGLL